LAKLLSKFDSAYVIITLTISKRFRKNEKEVHMKKYLQDQRGVAMVLELVLVAVVVVAVGWAVLTRYHSMQPVAAPQPVAVKVAPTVANGSVTNAVNSLTQESTGDAAVAKEEGSLVPTTDNSSGSAQNLEGSYNENSF
jgi:hypothetical protein